MPIRSLDGVDDPQGGGVDVPLAHGCGVVAIVDCGGFFFPTGSLGQNSGGVPSVLPTTRWEAGPGPQTPSLLTAVGMALPKFRNQVVGMPLCRFYRGCS